jgi:hypothetical protein
MPLFGRNRQPVADDPNLGGFVEEGDDGWRVSWDEGGGNNPPELQAASLTEVTDLATAAALARPRPSGGVLAFAIYPRKSGKKGVLYDVTSSPGQFTARDMQGSHREVGAANLDELLAEVRQQAGPDIAMLRWVRPFGELPSRGLEE